MTTTLWDTTGGDVVKALVAERRAGGAVSAGLAVTLVVVVDEKNVGKAEQAAMIASQQHPCRLIIVIRRQVDSADRLDAEVQVGGRLGPIEAVVMRMYGRLSLHAESVVLPLLAPDAPVVTWWHGPPPDELAADPLAVLADRRVTDTSLADDPIAALHQRVADFAPGDTDLAWTRITPWRSLLASAFDGVTATATQGRVAAAAGNPSAILLSAWVSQRLGIASAVERSSGPGVTEVEVLLKEEDVPGPDGTPGPRTGSSASAGPTGGWRRCRVRGSRSASSHCSGGSSATFSRRRSAGSTWTRSTARCSRRPRASPGWRNAPPAGRSCGVTRRRPGRPPLPAADHPAGGCRPLRRRGARPDQRDRPVHVDVRAHLDRRQPLSPAPALRRRLRCSTRRWFDS